MITGHIVAELRTLAGIIGNLKYSKLIKYCAIQSRVRYYRDNAVYLKYIEARHIYRR